jgi:hypothetical protein
MKVLLKIIAAMNIEANKIEAIKASRRLFALLGGAAIRGKFEETIVGIQDTWNAHATETATWVAPSILAAGKGGPFDACDLRHWMALAERAGVRAVPARTILELTEAETAAVSGMIPNTIGAAVQKRLSTLAQAMVGDSDSAQADGEPAIDMEALEERLYAAMDDVPEGSMVRHVRSGSSVLKGWAGTGIAGPTAAHARFGPDVEVGPGWVRLGNRRRIDTVDIRIVESTARGPDGQGAIFVARPWVAASRWVEAEDIHRGGSPIAGKGRWPCEWRCFIERGQVVGVARYYGWAGNEPTPEDARMALEAARLAQPIADEAVRQGAYPRYGDIELARRNEKLAACLADFPRDGVACCLDFIETAQGMLLLEGGPACSPIGGAHCCAFAGANGRPTIGNKLDTRGVAFRVMPGVQIAEPSTWRETDRRGCILTWEEARRLAEKENP